MSAAHFPLDCLRKMPVVLSFEIAFVSLVVSTLVFWSEVAALKLFSSVEMTLKMSAGAACMLSGALLVT